MKFAILLDVIIFNNNYHPKIEPYNEAKSRKYREVFKVKHREETPQAREN